MEENKDKKTTLTGKLQLKKTFNAGQIKQNFSHGRSKSVSVEVKKKRTFSTIDKQHNDNQSEEREVLTDEPNDTKKILTDLPKAPKEGIRDLNVKRSSKKPASKPILEQKKNLNDSQQEPPEKNRPPKFPKSPKSFENRRQGKLTISQALDDGNEKVRSLSASKMAEQEKKLSKEKLINQNLKKIWKQKKKRKKK